MRRRIVRRATRGVTLIEVLIVVTIMAVISGGAVLLVFPALEKAKKKNAYTGANVIQSAASAYREMDQMGASDACPTIADLVGAKKIDKNKTDDPWGRPFKIQCVEDGDIVVVSTGKDGKESTPDDIRSDMKVSELEKS